MKHLKIYEELNIGEPNVGDYVICTNNFFNENLREFLQNNIGRIINGEKSSMDYYIVFYEDIDDDLNKYFNELADGYEIPIFESEILYWNKNKEELQYIIDANKYNL
jgi:hypothetical protein